MNHRNMNIQLTCRRTQIDRSSSLSFSFSLPLPLLCTRRCDCCLRTLETFELLVECGNLGDPYSHLGAQDSRHS